MQVVESDSTKPSETLFLVISTRPSSEISNTWVRVLSRAKAERNAAPVATMVAAVDEEAREAVDYFGALRVIGAAFLFGLGAARRLKN